LEFNRLNNENLCIYQIFSSDYYVYIPVYCGAAYFSLNGAKVLTTTKRISRIQKDSHNYKKVLTTIKHEVRNQVVAIIPRMKRTSLLLVTWGSGPLQCMA